MKTAIVILIVCALIALLTGCSWMPFEGKRNIEFNLNILGNTLGWKSTVAGEYTQASAQVETPKAK